KDGTATKEIVVTINGADEIPLLGNSSATVSEEGLPGGNPDGLPAGSDHTDSASTSGTLDTTGSPTSFGFGNTAVSDLTALNLKSGGTALVWSQSGTTLTGTVGGVEALKITLDASTGEYNVLLSKPLDHADTTKEDVITLDLPVWATNAVGTAQGMLAVIVEDDSPLSGSATLNVSSAAPTQDTNLILMLDVSDSMGSITAAPTSSMWIAAKAANDLVRMYDTYGDVRVLVTLFGGSATTIGPATGDGTFAAAKWMTVSEAITAIDKASMNGGQTNTQAALVNTINAVNTLTTGPIAGGKYVSFMITDGAPTTSPDAAQLNTWLNLVDSKNINSFVLQVPTNADDYDDVNASAAGVFNTIAADGTIDPFVAASDTRIYEKVTNAGLAAKLRDLAIPSLSGNLLNGVDTAGNPVHAAAGGDGLGSISVVTVDGVKYGYDAATDKSSVNGVTSTSNGAIATFNDATNVWTVTLSGTNNKIAVDMVTANYTYSVKSATPAGGESFSYTFLDKDGDQGINTYVLHSDAVGSSTSGGGSNDTITGTAGPDILRGGAGDDVINGGLGNDIIYGGPGSDTLTGGAGRDWFVWEFSDFSKTLTTTDRIKDFVVGEDRIDISNLLQYAGAYATGGSAPYSNYLAWNDATHTLSIRASQYDSYTTNIIIENLGSYTLPQLISQGIVVI
ncbi:MAG: VWA domain-containing protein, partial [Brachymonas sp.]|nr:VWA domain-containing protein [Brachymonas sp.]